MVKVSKVAALLAAVGLAAISVPASAQDSGGSGKSPRRGGYSYSKEDTINTYGDSRSNYGSMNSLRDPKLDTQTTAGPFDHGFFFDSGIGARGGDSPYQN